MQVSLTPGLRRLVDKKVRSGNYGSPSEVVREALRLLERHDMTREKQIGGLRALLVEADADIRARRVFPLNDDLVEGIKAEGRRRATRRAAADRVVLRITAVCQRLARFPKTGRPRDEFRRGVRSVPVGNLVVF